MTRWKLLLEYDGTPFIGWQRQKYGRSVQQCLEEAITSFSGETVCVYGAGRTDTGVHALAQVCHFDLNKPTKPSTIRNALNFYLRLYPIVVLDVTPTLPTFHARFSAKRRRYMYRIINRHTPLALEKGRAWHIRHPLDTSKMSTAASFLIGYHDFSTFCNTSKQTQSPLKTLEQLHITHSQHSITIHTAAPSFLYSQVRNMVGTLVLVGLTRWKVEDVRTALTRRDRKAGGPTAPPYGLYFESAEYE